MPIEEIKERGFNLDIRNPTTSELDGIGAMELLGELESQEATIVATLSEIRRLMDQIDAAST